MLKLHIHDIEYYDKYIYYDIQSEWKISHY